MLLATVFWPKKKPWRPHDWGRWESPGRCGVHYGVRAPSYLSLFRKHGLIILVVRLFVRPLRCTLRCQGAVLLSLFRKHGLIILVVRLFARPLRRTLRRQGAVFSTTSLRTSSPARWTSRGGGATTGWSSTSCHPRLGRKTRAGLRTARPSTTSLAPSLASQSPI